MNRTTTEAVPSATPMSLLLAALLPFGLGYFLSYLFRAVNAVVAPNLVAELELSAGELGLVTSAYLLAFAVFQLPLGVLLDRYGPRRVQAVLLLVAASGAGLFAMGSSALQLILARALIGIGFAGGLMSGFKSVVIWVPEKRRALANSCIMSLGAIGLLTATTPMEWAVGLHGWRHVFLGLAALTALVAMIIVFIVPEREGASATDGLRAQVEAIGGIFADRGFLVLAPLLAATAGTHIAVQTLWAGPWFRDIAGLDRSGVAGHLFLMAAAFFAGILLTGLIADWFVRRGIAVLDVMVGFLALFLASQALVIADVAALRVPAWCLFGMTGQVAILAYPWLSTHFGAQLSGRANTAMNLLIFLAAFAVQWAMGLIIDLYPPIASGGYPAAAYHAAFGASLALEIATLLLYLANRRRLFADE